ncbi:MAG TPA: glycosyltransferase family 4 protein [Candidatus Saccharimonadales bacterium]
MISFVWSSKYPFLAGTGGSENYTAGQVRELMRRGIETRIITLGHGTSDGRDDFPDIPFLALDKKEHLSELDDTIVFITYPLNVSTKHKSYVILHCPPLSCARRDPLFEPKAFVGKKLITPSRYAAKLWSKQARQTGRDIATVYPFAEDCFSRVQRPARKGKKTRILFAGRLTPDKGVYTLLASLHMDKMQDLDYELTMTSACSHPKEGQVVRAILEAHPWVNLVPARRSPQEMAELMAEHDIVVMPSTDIFWHEAFGILSVEAQHAGCRVVASKAGGIPETNTGSSILVKADDPQALANGLAKAAALGPLTTFERAKASTKFTVANSVDTLLQTIEETSRLAMLPQKMLPHMKAVRRKLSQQKLQLVESVDHLKQDTYAVLGQARKRQPHPKNL